MSEPNDPVVVVYIDVDDTFVRTFGSKRIPVTPVIEHVRALAQAGVELYCWSSGGADYARICATEFGIVDCFRAFLPKPSALIDDQLVDDWRGLRQFHPNECHGPNVDQYRDLMRMPSSSLTGMSTAPLPTYLAKIGLIGDIHQQDELLEIALRSLATMGLDAILCTGDVINGTGNAERCFELVREYGVVTIRGNHDRWLVQYGRPVDPAEPELSSTALLQLRLLPPTLSFDTPAGRLLLCHGLGKNDLRELHADATEDQLGGNLELQQLRMSEYAIAINGHMHKRMVRDFEGIIVINAGTLRADRDPVFSTGDFGDRVVQFFGFGEAGVVVQEACRF